MSRTADRERCRTAGIGDEVPFATENEHFTWMSRRAVDARVPFSWVTWDEAYGRVEHLGYWPEERRIAHAPATKVDDTVITAGRTEARVDEPTATLPRQARKRISGGRGSHGEPIHDWARAAIQPVWENGFGHRVLARRSVGDPSEIATTSATTLSAPG